MDELKDRLRALDAAPSPDLWQEAVERMEGVIDPRRAPSPTRSGRRGAVVALAAALTLAAGAIALSAGSGDRTHTLLVPTSAMEPTLERGRCATIDTDAYQGSSPARGDVIAFRDAEVPGIVMIARVIGLPGERIEQTQGAVFVDGEALEEPYAIPDRRGTLDGAWTVEQDHLFVMGDNRPISNDSRSSLGQVPLDALEGAVLTDEAPSGCLSAPPAPTVEG